MAYTKPQQRNKEESEMLRGEREIRSSLSILDLKDGRFVDSGKQEESKRLHKLHVLEMFDDLWDNHGINASMLQRSLLLSSIIL